MNNKKLREKLLQIGSETDDNKFAVAATTFVDGKVRVDNIILNDILWNIESKFDDNSTEGKALRIALILFKNVEKNIDKD